MVACWVMCGCEAGSEVLVEHGTCRGEHEDKKSRRCRAPISGVAASQQVGKSRPNGLQLGKRTRGNVLSEGSMGVYGEEEW